MLDTLKALFRHYRLKDFGGLAVANLGCLIPLVASLTVPVLLASEPGLGLAALLGGFVVTGQALALTGRLLDRRFRGDRPGKGSFLRAWASGWAEGLVLAAVLGSLFSLAFSSIPYYWAQGSAFGWFSLGTLAVGTLLILGALPYYLPVRRREGLGLVKAAVRCFRLMNDRPALALAGLGLGALALAASLGTFGLFPGFGGLAAFHQGLYDRAVSSE